MRHQRRHAADGRGPGGRRRPRPGRRAGSASTARTTPAARWPTRLAAVEAGVTHVQGTANGYGERAGNADTFALIANLVTKMGLPVVPPRVPGRAAAGQPRDRRAGQHRPRRPPALRRRLGVRAQGRPARQRDQGEPGAVQPPRPGRRRQRHAHPRHRDGRPGIGRAQGPGARRRPRRPRRRDRPGRRPGQGARGRRLVLRGRRRLLRAAAARPAARRAAAAVRAGELPDLGRALGQRRRRQRGDGQGAHVDG